MRTTGRILAVVGSAILLAAASAPAMAGVIIDQGPGNFPGDQNVLFNACNAGDAVLGPANTVTGCLNQDKSILVDFTSTSMLEVVGGGQARVEGQSDSLFSDLQINLQVGNFSTLITNVQVSNDRNGQPQQTTLTIQSFLDDTTSDTQMFQVSESGQNFFRISNDMSMDFTKVVFTVQNGGINSVLFEDFRQNRIGPGDPNEVPEPATLGLLGVGLVGIGFAARRRRKAA